MTVKIDRYQIKRTLSKPYEYTIKDMQHGEKFVWIESTNKELSEKLIEVCLEYLNKGELSND